MEPDRPSRESPASSPGSRRWIGQRRREVVRTGAKLLVWGHSRTCLRQMSPPAVREMKGRATPPGSDDMMNANRRMGRGSLGRGILGSLGLVCALWVGTVAGCGGPGAEEGTDSVG